MLTAKSEMTEKNLEAHRANAHQSQGPSTPEGKERARDAHLKHGCFSRDHDEVLRVLGDDPEYLAELVEGGYRQWRPSNTQQEWMVHRLAIVQMRIDRAHRVQEVLAAQGVHEERIRHDETVRDVRRQVTRRWRFLDVVCGLAARPDFYSGPIMVTQATKELKRDVPDQQRMVALLGQLGKPRQFPAPLGPSYPGAYNDEKWKFWRGWIDEGPAESSPPVAAVEGAEREPLRKELYLLADGERYVAHRVRKMNLHGGRVWNYKRAVMVLKMACTNQALQREEAACIREMSRLMNLLMKAKQQEAAYREEDATREAAASPEAAKEPNPDVELPQTTAAETDINQQNVAAEQDRTEQKAAAREERRQQKLAREQGAVTDRAPAPPAPGVEPPAPAPSAPAATSATDDTASAPLPPSAAPSITTTTENEGSSGDMLENKGPGKELGTPNTAPEKQNTTQSAVFEPQSTVFEPAGTTPTEPLSN